MLSIQLGFDGAGFLVNKSIQIARQCYITYTCITYYMHLISTDRLKKTHVL